PSNTANIYYVSVSSPGVYAVLPTNPVTATGGSGTGATFNVYDGAVKPMLSPFGPIGPWQSVGVEWGTSQLMPLVQSWYPNPPLILFISNNEANKLQWPDAETDQHYLTLYGVGQSDEFKREVVAQGWTTRYRAL